MHDLYKLKDNLVKELEELGKQDLSKSTLETVDKLAHAAKNVAKVIECCEEEEYSMAGGSYRGGRYSRDGGQGGQGGGGNRGGGSSYARGRGRNARRDSMGRYSSEGGYRYSRDGYSIAEDGMEDIVEELRGMMDDLPDEKKREVQKFIQKVEQM